MMNPLLDNDFLDELSKQKEREIYAKIIALDMDENPIEEITGNVTQGSVSVDGSSVVRRSCSITLVAQDFNINDYYWGLNTKIKVYVGMRNIINDKYPEIIWFPQGIFVVTSFNTSQSTTGWTISLQGKDKMCLLNGDMGGTITEISFDFGHKKVETEIEDVFEERDELLKDIIVNVVHTYAHEPYSNIIVNDLDDVGLELLQYRSDTAMYLLVNLFTNEVENFRMDGDFSGSYYMLDENGNKVKIALNEIPVYDSRITLDFGEGADEFTTIYTENSEIPYSVIKVTYGDVVGYRITDLTYAGDLIGAVGNSITQAVLDKIVSQLGDFEYFYNLDGQFVFQRKQVYINTLFNNLVQNHDEDTYANNAMQTSSFTYSFEDSNLITAFQNAPALANVKNDYAVWGTRKSKATGTEIPVHLRYAIDKKPYAYTTYGGITYLSISKEEYIKKLTEQVKQEIEIALNQMSHYRKKPNPNKLPEDWWEILDWAEYYKLLYGSYPDGHIGQYANEGRGMDGMEKTDLTQYFRMSEQDIPGSSYFMHSPIYIFDIIYQGKAIEDSVIGYTGHGCSCSHPYSYFTNRARSGEGTSYIYKPVLPSVLAQQKYEKVLKDIEDQLKNKILRCDCDWRELIYQMARDDSLYHHNPDGTINENFIPTLIKNNGNLYPSGSTGYEQYYIDIYSFWRDLYNPDPDVYDDTEFYDKVPNAEVRVNWNDYIGSRNLYQYDKGSHSYILLTDDLPDKILGDKNSIGESTVPKYSYNNNAEYYRDKPDKVVYQYDDTFNPPYRPLNLYGDIIVSKPIPPNMQFYNKYGEPYETNIDSIFLRTVTNYFSSFNSNLPYYFFNMDGKYEELQIDEESGQKFFDVTKDYYAFRGYIAAPSIKIGYTYYRRKSNNGTYGYEYEKVFDLPYGVIYSSTDGTSVTFERGKTYLANGVPFTIPHENLYIRGGDNEGYAPIYKGGSNPEGRYYYLNKETGEFEPAPDRNLAAIGTMNYCYIEATQDNLTSGLAYRYNATTGNYEEINALLKFDPQGQYFIIENNELVRYEHRIFRQAGDEIVTNEKSEAQLQIQEKIDKLIEERSAKEVELMERTDLTYMEKQALYEELMAEYEAPLDSLYKEMQSLNITLSGQYYLNNNFNKEGWTCDLNTPELLNFWFDFLDTEGELSQYSVPTIGIRPKAENNKDVTSIYYRETPTVIFVDPDDDITEQKNQKPGFTFVRCPDYVEQLFSLSTQKKSAKDQLDILLYKHTYCTETITITCLPVYHLRPNTRIFVHDEKSGINGEYIVTKFTVPLAYNGTMSITATKAVENMY